MYTIACKDGHHNVSPAQAAALIKLGLLSIPQYAKDAAISGAVIPYNYEFNGTVKELRAHLEPLVSTEPPAELKFFNINPKTSKSEPAYPGQAVQFRYYEMATEFHITSVPYTPVLVYGGENRNFASFTIPEITKPTEWTCKVVGESGAVGVISFYAAPRPAPEPPKPEPTDDALEQVLVDLSAIEGALSKVYWKIADIVKGK